jgi:hypothetical protein
VVAATLGATTAVINAAATLKLTKFAETAVATAVAASGAQRFNTITSADYGK